MNKLSEDEQKLRKLFEDFPVTIDQNQRREAFAMIDKTFGKFFFKNLLWMSFNALVIALPLFIGQRAVTVAGDSPYADLSQSSNILLSDTQHTIENSHAYTYAWPKFPNDNATNVEPMNITMQKIGIMKPGIDGKRIAPVAHQNYFAATGEKPKRDKNLQPHNYTTANEGETKQNHLLTLKADADFTTPEYVFPNKNNDDGIDTSSHQRGINTKGNAVAPVDSGSPHPKFVGNDMPEKESASPDDKNKTNGTKEPSTSASKQDASNKVKKRQSMYFNFGLMLGITAQEDLVYNSKGSYSLKPTLGFFAEISFDSPLAFHYSASYLNQTTSGFLRSSENVDFGFGAHRTYKSVEAEQLYYVQNRFSALVKLSDKVSVLGSFSCNYLVQVRGTYREGEKIPLHQATTTEQKVIGYTRGFNVWHYTYGTGFQYRFTPRADLQFRVSRSVGAHVDVAYFKSNKSGAYTNFEISFLYAWNQRH